jgi:hypothetical protein
MKLVLFALAFLGTATLTGCTGDKDDSSGQQTDSGTDSGT